MENDLELAKIGETIMDLIEDHVLVCNREGLVMFSNRAMRANLGYSEAELNGQSFFDIVAKQHVKKARFFIQNIAKQPLPWEDFLLICREGAVKLQLKFLQKDHYIYIYGNQKYVEYERVRKKLDIEIANAIKIHKRFLPDVLPSTEQISFASLYIPAEELGGDIYDAFKVDHGLLNDYFDQYVCFIADVSGHGLDSAMLAIFVKDTINNFFKLKHIPGQLLSPQELMNFFVEQYLKEGYPEEYMVCLFIVAFDLKTKELLYCNAGFHVCPLLIKDADNIIELRDGGPPVSTGIPVELLCYEDSSLDVSQSITLFIMSDGLPEQESADNEMYQDRLKELMKEIYSLEPQQMVAKIQEDFKEFLGEEKIRDDITLIAAKLNID